MSASTLALIILAAGEGSRYGGLKQLTPVGPGGESLLEYSAYDALRSGFESIVLVVRAETEDEFRRRLGSGLEAHAPVTFVHQRLDDLPEGFEPPRTRDRPWGTGHALLAAADVAEGPFAVVNADDFYGARSYELLADFLRGATDRELAVVGFRVSDTLTEAGAVSRAVLQTDRVNRLRKIDELLEVWGEGGQILYRDADGRRRRLDDEALVSMNMWGFSPAALPALAGRFADFLRQADLPPEAEFLLPDAVQALVSTSEFRVEVLSGGGSWCGMTYRQDESRVRSFLATLTERGDYPPRLWGARS